MMLTRGMLLSPHFTVDEVLKSAPNITAIPTAVLPNVRRAAAGMEELRALLDRRPITPTSWYRDAENNARVNGVQGSNHMTGYALDFTVKGVSPRDVMRVISTHAVALGVDKAIEYPGHVHVSFDPRRRASLLLAVGKDQFVPWNPSEAKQYMASEPGTPNPGSKAWWLGLMAALITALVAYLSKAPGVAN